MSLLKLRTIDKTLLISENAVFTSGSVSVDSIEITIDNTWVFDNAEYFLCCESSEISTEGKTPLIRNGNVLTCDVPIFVTANPADWEIGIYAEQNALRIKTSTLVNVTVTQGAKTDTTDPYEPIKKEAYDKGYNEGYKAGGVFEKQVTLWGESDAFSRDDLSALFQLGSSDNLVDLPFISFSESFNPNYNYVKSGKGIRSFALDFSKCLTKSISYAYFTNSKPVLQKAILTGVVDEKTSVSSWSRYFSSCKNLKEVYFDKLELVPKATGSARSFGDLFYGCVNLKIIGGFNKDTKAIDNMNFGYIDFSRVEATDRMFDGCERLEEFSCVANSLQKPLGLQSSTLLAKETVLSLINACDATTPTVLYLTNIVKSKMESGNWYCIFNEDTGLWEDYDAETKPVIEGVYCYAYALTSDPSIITGAKGWAMS